MYFKLLVLSSMDIITFSFNHEKEIVCRISFSFLSVISPNFRSPSVQCQLSDFEVFYFCEMINDISIHFRLPNQLNLGDFLIRFCLSSSSRIPAFFPGIANNVHMPSSMWQYVIYHCLFSKNSNQWSYRVGILCTTTILSSYTLFVGVSNCQSND